jgi:hypothetical protein
VKPVGRITIARQPVLQPLMFAAPVPRFAIVAV